jgi:hypothetical protein
MKKLRRICYWGWDATIELKLLNFVIIPCDWKALHDQANQQRDLQQG